jgi:hypothetical protein
MSSHSTWHFSDSNGNESVLYLLPDETPDVPDCAARLTLATPEHIAPLVLKPHELFMLALPFSGPRQPPGATPNQMNRQSIHNWFWARQCISAVYGHDRWAHLLSGTRGYATLLYCIELSAEVVRYSVVLSGLTSGRSIVRELGKVMDDLMLSLLLLEQVHPYQSRDEVAECFSRVVVPDLAELLIEWQKIEQEAKTMPYSTDLEYHAAWLYETFCCALGKYLYNRWGHFSDGARQVRYQHRGERLRSTLSRSSAKTGEHTVCDIYRYANSRPDTFDYYDAVHTGINVLESIQNEIVSIVLYGSMARDSLRPQRSDILDAYVVVDDGYCESETCFIRVLSAIVRSCRVMAEGKVPFHPFKLVSWTEWGYRHPANYLAEWSSNALSRIVIGRDIRSQAGSSAVGVLFSRLALFTLPIISRRCGRYLYAKELAPKDIAHILQIVSVGAKLVPRWLCAAHDVWLDGARARTRAAELVPDLDLSIVETASTLLVHSPSTISTAFAKDLLRRILLCVEAAVDATLPWMGESGDPFLVDFLLTTTHRTDLSVCSAD